jgi:uncharacterized membrane protein YeaQ/YmgE (transglycosylase-associated protein family)
MSVLAPIVLSVIVGWLATLTLQSARHDVLVLDFTIAVAGAGLAAILIAPSVGVDIIGPHGATMSGVGRMYVSALVVLSARNLLRSGHFLSRRSV